MKTALLILLLAITHVAMAQSIKSISLAWDYSPADGLTNYYFNVRTSTNLSQPLPWPVLTSVTNALTANFSTYLASGASQFFYITVNDIRSSSTNLVYESDPSNTVSVRSLPSGTLSIRKGQ